MKNIILCHKCAGVLVCEPGQDKDLLGCQCISGWVRGFESVLDRAEAIAAQIKANEQRLATYIRQGRSASWLDRVQVVINRLVELQAKEAAK